MTNVLGVTLARGGSKGITKKNLAVVGGKPLIQHTFDIIPNINLLNDYIVSSDCDEIIDYSKSQKILVPFKRPSFLATDKATSLDALVHATLFMEDLRGIRYDCVVELMCTNPFKTADHVNDAIEKLVKTGADSVIGVSQVEEYHPARLKKIVDDKIIDFCVPELSSRRQDLRPFAYIRNGSIYAINRDKLVEEGHRFGGDNSRPLLMPARCNINIDSELDLALANIIFQQTLP
jgi:CMP-N-acetylneuraminic acid synthetase